MAARPVIYAISEGNDLVAEAGCGLSVPAEDPQALAEGIRCLKSMSPQERDVLGKKGRDYILKHRLYEILAQEYLNEIN